MNDVSEILLKGGPVALIVLTLLAGKYIVDYVVKLRSSRRQGTTATVTDAATTNAMLLETLRSERAESRTKDARIDELEAECATLHDQMFALRRDYEEELSELRKKIQEVTLQLEGLQQRIHQGLPNNPPNQ